VSEATDFLYPFIEATERDPTALLADLAASARAKIVESLQVRQITSAKCADTIRGAADAIACASTSGGRLFVFGNGGSAADARLAADRFRAPGHGRPVAAISLADAWTATTALGNDIGFDKIFARQLEALGRAGDVAVGFSTSGSSLNVLLAFTAARRAGMVTIGFAGYDGGAFAVSDDLDFCLVARSESIHRIQEAHGVLVADLWQAVQDRLARTAEPPSQATRTRGSGDE
jgi:D-sedoheptulose 7-phosphate isomerase